MAYSIEVREEGRGPATIRKFENLWDVQKYVRDRWQGVEYIDGPNAFHSDYCTFDMYGAMLRDLGEHAGPWGTQDYWQWNWFELCRNCGGLLNYCACDDDSDTSPAGPIA